MAISIVHWYLCELCGYRRACRLKGCQKDCTKVCEGCMRANAYDPQD